MQHLALDHVAIAVPSIAAAAPLYERVTGEERSVVEVVGDQGVAVAFVGMLELLEPRDPAGTVARFLERNGPGLHHVAYRTPDLRAELARLREEGFELIDAEPRTGAFGHRVAFLHPRGTGKVLVELVERSDAHGVPGGAATSP
ncbi:MAG: methylmalonyl-CoA epimerase [Gemmatimonadota bacterium]|jgi:methylmalonyl-CoA/ethylmalonyl-CoA epimerase